MGHTRLGELPKTLKWNQVVTSLLGGDFNAGEEPLSDHIQRISRLTLEAAQGGLERATEDLGLRYAFYVLTQVALSSRNADWETRLQAIGIDLDPDADLIDLTTEVQSAIDEYVFTHGNPSDISEIAQRAVGEALATLISRQSRSLLGSSRDQLREAVRTLSTKTEFSRLGQVFFGYFISRYLNFYLSRATAANVGGKYLNQIGDISTFNDRLLMHCLQSAVIVRDFCGDWYSVTEFREGITVENTSRFMAVALKKLRNEMARQRKAI